MCISYLSSLFFFAQRSCEKLQYGGDWCRLSFFLPASFYGNINLHPMSFEGLLRSLARSGSSYFWAPKPIPSEWKGPWVTASPECRNLFSVTWCHINNETGIPQRQRLDSLRRRPHVDRSTCSLSLLPRDTLCGLALGRLRYHHGRGWIGREVSFGTTLRRWLGSPPVITHSPLPKLPRKHPHFLSLRLQPPPHHHHQMSLPPAATENRRVARHGNRFIHQGPAKSATCLSCKLHTFSG